ncbi:phage tail assembly chaperone [Bacilliculturomica massiliensis]|uniref:phage tail assembly chaperone n=1 Tax=Bacilliculturomica massiliensis TaxID=1917867 RepID=UPI0010312035|nr:phage portal protein [Bacilliculturomica massiliensis]
MSLKSFLKQSAILPENQKVVVSNRFVDEDGKPEEWEIQPITATENDKLMEECMKRVAVAGKRGQFTETMDRGKYMRYLAAACVVYPNLNDPEIQNSYGAMSAEELIGKMLFPGELTALLAAVNEMTGFDAPIEDKVDEAKN